MKVFRTLMARRAMQLSIDHVEALNMIDVEFSKTSGPERVVAVAWKEYLDHLNKPAASEGWSPRKEDLYCELLYKMALCLGYDFDKVHIKNQSYSPIAYSNLEEEQRTIRQCVMAVLNGERSIPIHTGAAPVPSPGNPSRTPAAAQSIPVVGAPGQKAIPGAGSGA